MNGKETRTSEKEAHLVIQCFQKNNVAMVEERIKIARAAAYKLMGAGIHGYNSMGTEIVLQEELKHVIPTLLYGLDAQALGESEYNTLESFHQQCLQCIQHLHQSTATADIHLLIPLVKALIIIRALSFFQNITDYKETSQHQQYSYMS